MRLTTFAALSLLGCASSEQSARRKDCPACPPAPACPASEPDHEPTPDVEAEQTQRLDVDLPRAEIGSDTPIVAVSLSADGKCFFAAQALASCDEISARAAEYRAKNPEVRAVIQADRAVSHGSVIAVIDQLKRAGIAKIAFAVSPRP